jgi:hypothetical protein
MMLQMQYNKRSGQFFLLNEFGDMTIEEYNQRVMNMKSTRTMETLQINQPVSAVDYYSGRKTSSYNSESKSIPTTSDSSSRTTRTNDESRSSDFTIKQVVFNDGDEIDYNAGSDYISIEDNTHDPRMNFFEERFGSETTTDDVEGLGGEMTKNCDKPAPKRFTVAAAVSAILGVASQQGDIHQFL